MGLTTREVQQLMGIEPDAEDEARIRADERAKIAESIRRKVGCRVVGDVVGRARDAALLEVAREIEEGKL